MTLPAVFFVIDGIPAPAWFGDYPRDKASDDTTIELRVTVVPDVDGYRFYASQTPGFTDSGYPPRPTCQVKRATGRNRS